MNIREIIDIGLTSKETADHNYQIYQQSLEEDKKRLVEHQPASFVGEQWKQEKLARVDSRIQDHVKNGPRRKGYVSLFKQNLFLFFSVRGR